MLTPMYLQLSITPDMAQRLAEAIIIDWPSINIVVDFCTNSSKSHF